MKLKTIVITVALLAVLSAIVWWGGRQEGPVSADPRVGKPVVDSATVESAKQLRLSDQGKTLTFTREADGSWRDDGYYGFPADFSKLSSFVNDLVSANIQRLVTTSPARMARLDFKDSKIELLDSSGRPIWSLTLGKSGESSGRFVRFDDEAKAYFSTLNAWLDTDAKGWANSTLLDLKPDDLAKLEISFDHGAPVTVSRPKKDGSWTADKTPAHQMLKSDKISPLLSTLGSLRFSDTSDLGDAAVATARKFARTFKLTTFDGKTVTVILGRKPEERKLKPVEKKAAPPAPSPSASAKTPAKKPAKAPEPEYETIPAGPVYVWVASSDDKAPVNALMRKRAFQVDDSTFTGLPQMAGELFEPVPSK